MTPDYRAELKTANTGLMIFHLQIAATHLEWAEKAGGIYYEDIDDAIASILICGFKIIIDIEKERNPTLAADCEEKIAIIRSQRGR